MASLNQVQLIGNCGRDPEVRYLPSGQAVANVSLATTSKHKDKNSGEMVEDTQWHRITFYERLAEIAGEYVKKGSSIFVQGRIKYGKYTDKDGVEKTSVDIIASQLTLLGGREQGGGQGGGQSRGQQGAAPRNDYNEQRGGGAPRRLAQAPGQQRPSTGFDDMDDDIPF